ncbi:arylmalonate decarboxylase [Nocardia sp. CDC159]|uniref:Arylmalonate decarboxylase n=1 Tax=Nocardia pulmonis TaxID=2951408 RepID=A0A9X2E2J1_9NOCA|nr:MULTISPECIES: arylmalonate decarboxylase [Nocardia]MCM6771918.1 arylmalonate decarboxylase [Nocardia pulmonis]MCM6785424.1 arylmalonate decarboxylase [Nocardia sp. CDC159]
MPDVLGWRAKFGVLAPSTNTVVEPDFARMGVPGVTAHFGRIHIRDQNMGDDAGMGRLLEQIRAEIAAACERVMTCEPDYMVMGMSAETFWGGVEGNQRFVRQIQDLTGLRVATGAEACRRALELYGAKRIGVVTPYQPVGDENVVRFFGELGFEVAAIKGLRCPTAVSIAHVTEDELRQALRAVDGEQVDALVQCGTNLSMVRLADEAERWLAKPVLAINAATWWMALRDNGISDRVEGAGALLREH